MRKLHRECGSRGAVILREPGGRTSRTREKLQGASGGHERSYPSGGAQGRVGRWASGWSTAAATEVSGRDGVAAWSLALCHVGPASRKPLGNAAESIVKTRCPGAHFLAVDPASASIVDGSPRIPTELEEGDDAAHGTDATGLDVEAVGVLDDPAAKIVRLGAALLTITGQALDEQVEGGVPDGKGKRRSLKIPVDWGSGDGGHGKWRTGASASSSAAGGGGGANRGC